MTASESLKKSLGGQTGGKVTDLSAAAAADFVDALWQVFDGLHW